MQTTVASSPWLKGRAEQRIATIKEVAGKTILQHQVPCEVAHALNQRAGRLGISPSYTSFWTANEGLRRTDGTQGGPSPSDDGRRRRRAGKTFHHSGFGVRGLGRTCCLGSDQKSSCHTFPTNENPRAWYPLLLLQTPPRQTSGNGNAVTMSGTPPVLIGPHGRSSWWVRFGGRGYLCATEHLRGVTPDELLKAAVDVPENYENPQPVEVATEPPRQPEEPSHDDLDIGVDAVEQITPLEGAGATEIGEQTGARLWPESLTGKQQEVRSSKGLVWRSP